MKRTLVAVALAATSFAATSEAQSVENGEKLFKRCMSCHQIGDGAKNRSGPILTGVVGRPAGSIEGFKYSKDLKVAAKAGLVWSPETIDAWLTDPTKYLRATTGNKKARAKMKFKLSKAGDRADVIAYLGTFQSAAAAVPKDGFCIVNASSHVHVFTTESREGARQMAELAPGDRLCASGTGALDGIVSVFENADALEGCSRIVPVGTAEELLVYAEFDRCGWGSHRS